MSELGGNLSNVYMAQTENVLPGEVKNNTHITWKGQLGVWMNLSSRM